MSVADVLANRRPWHVAQGHALTLLRQMPTASIHTVVTSPPYYGLRSYSTEPQVWGGAPDCEHDWREGSSRALGRHDEAPEFLERRSARYQTGTVKASTGGNVRTYAPAGATCVRCSAWSGELGQEPTLALFIAHLVEIFGEVRRVLRDDGTCWVNVGDSYSGGGGFAPDAPSNRRRAEAGSGQDGAFRFSPRVQERQPNGKPAGTRDAGLKPKNLMLVPPRLAIALQDSGWYVRSHIIWCLSGGTRVYAKTQKGEMPMTIKDMVRLNPSTVQLWNGERWTQALGWNETPRPDAPLELILRSGERIGCTADHQWPTRRGLVRAADIVPGDVIDVVGLPEPARPKSPSRLDDALIGWFVGLYLAEGNRDKDTLKFSLHADETAIHDRLREVADAFDGSYNVFRSAGNGCVVSLSGPVLLGLVDQYISGTLAADKHLGVRCWRRSNEFLRHLLTGYLEGDGHFDAPNNRWRLGFCQNDNLAADLRTLCARLRYSCRLKRVSHVNGQGSFPGWRGQIRTTPSLHVNTKPDTEVMSIGRSRARRFWDIGVEDEPHLFALASGVLTHNSKKSCMPESVTDRPTSAHESIFLLTKRPRYFFDAEAVREEAVEPWGGLNEGVAPATKNHHVSPQSAIREGVGRLGNHPNGRNLRNVWHLGPEPYAEAHFATFPTEIPRRAILAGTSARGVCGAKVTKLQLRADLTPEQRARVDAWLRRKRA